MRCGTACVVVLSMASVVNGAITLVPVDWFRGYMNPAESCSVSPGIELLDPAFPLDVMFEDSNTDCQVGTNWGSVCWDISIGASLDGLMQTAFSRDAGSRSGCRTYTHLTFLTDSDAELFVDLRMFVSAAASFSYDIDFDDLTVGEGGPYWYDFAIAPSGAVVKMPQFRAPLLAGHKYRLWIKMEYENDNHVDVPTSLNGTARFRTGQPCLVTSDLDFDGDVDMSDLLAMLAEFGVHCEALPLTFQLLPLSCATGDVDLDGDVDISDVGILLSEFGQACP